MKLTYQSRELYHFGVPGMKWGHRSGGKTSSSGKSIASKKMSDIDKEKVKKGALIAAGVVGTIGGIGLGYYIGHSAASKSLAKKIGAHSLKIGKAAVEARKLGKITSPSSMSILEISFEDAMRYAGRIY